MALDYGLTPGEDSWKKLDDMLALWLFLLFLLGENGRTLANFASVKLDSLLLGSYESRTYIYY
jgi:hypothetical protein